MTSAIVWTVTLRGSLRSRLRMTICDAANYRASAMIIAEPFSGDVRHARRIAQVGAYETDGTLVDTPAPRVRS